MPLSKYNKFFGGKPGSAEKAHAAMAEEYGPEKGEQVFYAKKNKNKSQQEDSPVKHAMKKAAGKKKGGVWSK